MVLLAPTMQTHAATRPGLPQQGQQAQQVPPAPMLAPYPNPMITVQSHQIMPRLPQQPGPLGPAGVPSQSPSPRFAPAYTQPPSPRAAQLLPGQPPAAAHMGPPHPWQPPSPRAAPPPLGQPLQPRGPRLPAGLQLTPSQLQQLQQAAVRPQAVRPPPPPPLQQQQPGQVPSPRPAAPSGQAAASPPLSPRLGPAASAPTAFTEPQETPAAPASVPAAGHGGGGVPLLLSQPIRPIALPPGPHCPLQRLLEQHHERQAAGAQQAQQAQPQQEAAQHAGEKERADVPPPASSGMLQAQQGGSNPPSPSHQQAA